MTDFKRNELTFEQAEGVAPLPTQMALKHVGRVLRARLWDWVVSDVKNEMQNEMLNRSLGPRWRRLYTDYCVSRLAMFSDKIEETFDGFSNTIRPTFGEGNYAEVLGTIEWLVRQHWNNAFSSGVERILIEERCAYRLVEGSMMPIASAQEGEAVIGALTALQHSGLSGAKAHLSNAGSLLTAGDFAGSVRESIHSVESVARTLTGEASLAKALQEIQKRHPMHPALRNGFNNIYGYTSDANGIRHPMVGDEGTAVGEPEAIFMLGACASFVTYLTEVGKAD